MASDDAPPGTWPDVIVISHNHYDHLDVNTMKAFISRPNGRLVPHVFCTSGNAAWFHALGMEIGTVTELDWWETRIVERPSDHAKLRLTCTPAQHFSGRSLSDRDRTLWGGFTFEMLHGDTSVPREKTGAKVYFAGDTGYRTINKRNITEEEEDALPYCPAFEEIGEKLGPFDMALIPIGAYAPRTLFSPIHCSPHDAVRMHREVKSRKTFGIHFGVFKLTAEAVDEPPKLLQDEAKKIGLPADEFDVLEIGQTVSVPVVL